MKIDSKIKVHDVADEKIIMLQGKKSGDIAKVISLNPTSLWLWNELHEKDFSESDVSSLLMSRFEIDERTARKDSKNWINTLVKYGVIE